MLLNVLCPMWLDPDRDFNPFIANVGMPPTHTHTRLLTFSGELPLRHHSLYFIQTLECSSGVRANSNLSL